MNLNEKRIFITGGSGLIGPWLVEDLLNENAEIICLIRDIVPQSRLFKSETKNKIIQVHGDLRDYLQIERIINEYEPEWVIHLGAQALVQTANRSPLGTFESNITGTWNILEACRMHNCVKSIVVASSDKAYGDQDELPYTENSCLRGLHPYDVSKSCADLIAQTYGKTYSMPVSISRCGNFFGGGDLNFSRIVPGTIKSLYENKNPEIRSDGKNIRDYIYVKDAVSAYKLLAKETEEKQLHGEAYNFSNEEKFTVLEMVELIAKLMGKKIEPVILNRAKGEIKHQHLSAEKARTELGWKSQWKVEEGLKETIDWYVNFFKGE